MKIGILTYHNAHNYGAVLQCYALKRYLRMLGHNVYVIDYRPRYIRYGLYDRDKWISLNPIKFAKKLWVQIRLFKKQKKRFDAFNNFIKTYISPQYINLNVTENDTDCFIFGSDQIWRKTNDAFDPIYWGGFKAASSTTLISYAASMGKDSLSAQEESQIQEWLRHFTTVMVRETSLKEVLTPIFNNTIDVVVDPTLLLSACEWDEIAVLPKRERPYILVYQVIDNPAALDIAKEVAKVMDAEIIELASEVKARKVCHTIVDCATPCEFLGWIRCAAMVVTTSFHGTAFSIIYRKPFVSVKQNRPSDLRISSILESCCLQDRFLDCDKWAWSTTLLEEPSPKCELIDFSKQRLKSVLTKSS